MTSRDQNLVSTEWLEDHLDAPDVIILDASWYLPTEERDAQAEYRQEHIPGAVFFDIDAHSDRSSDLPHMLPNTVAFSSAMRKLGVGDGQKIVIYDGAGLFSAARVWWTFKTMGASDVVVLDGGLPKWKAEGRALDSGTEKKMERHFTARLDHGRVRDLGEMKRNVETTREQVIDARPAARFKGEAAEPRPNTRSGHMPGSINIPFNLLLDDQRCFKSNADIKAVFDGAGVDLSRPITASCGSGVTAAVLALGLELIGIDSYGLYDGSWSEWGQDNLDTPVVTG
ncbi:3-mercaptopyruvate sulfurtransferase [Coralliovum pocilloporae]|uniref:3-mercaptopyruvate sulfurtransferase n=1 Tax=Coralliovum pocilloporae TaxID=3066369 RepID=UPI003306CE2D